MSALAVAVAVATSAATVLAVPAGRLGHVWQQRQLAGALDGRRDLVLVAPARPGDAPGADLPAVGDELPQGRDVLVVDELDLVAAERARLAPAGAASRDLLPPARRRPAALLGHWLEPFEVVSTTGCSAMNAPGTRLAERRSLAAGRGAPALGGRADAT